jgi:hypothetical protein
MDTELIKKVRTIIQEDYGEDLEDEELANFINSLANYFKLLNKIKKNNAKRNKK